MDIATIELLRANFKQGESVKGVARLKLADKFAGRVELFWQDSHGRIIERIERAARFPSAQTLKFAFKLDKFPMSLVNKIVVQATDDLLVRRSRAEARFTITPPRYKWEDYEIIVWGEKRAWATEAWVEAMKQNGVTAGMAYEIKPPRPRRESDWLADGDLRFYVENVCQIGWDGKLFREFMAEFVSKAYAKGNEQVPDKRYLVRKPCLNDPAYWAASRKRIHDAVRARDEYGPLAYNIGDEQSLAFFTTPYDFCFSEHCLAEFRKWLRKSYGSLDALNATWETDFASWDAVTPMTREEVRIRAGKGSRSFAPWADHREFMDATMADLVKRFIGYFHELVPGAHVGIEGTQKPSIYGGFDYWRLMNIPLSFHEIYDIGGSHRIAQSFNRNRCPTLSLIGCDRDNREHMWQRLFHGDLGTVIWWLPAFHNPDGTVREPVKVQKGTWKEITGGIARLLDLDRSVHDGVAIHYSPASYRAHWIGMKDIPFSGDHEIANVCDHERIGFMRLVEDLGYTYRFAAYEQVAKGGLADYKAFVMPGSIALSDAEAEGIRRFVKAGGVVIADYKAGWMDEHCRMRPAGALDDVFGISRRDFSTEPFETFTSKRGGSYWFEHVPPLGDHQVLVNRNFESVVGISQRLFYPTVESTLKATTGQAIGHEGDIPAVIINRFGKGLAVYLNFRLLYYANHRVSTQDQIFAQTTVNLLRQILRLAGVAPAAEVLGAPLVERVMFVDGQAEYHGLRRNPGGEQRGLGEVAGGQADVSKPANVSMKFKAAKHTYDLRAGQYLGLTDSASGTLKHPEPLVYSRLPYRVEALDVSAGTEFKGGEKVTARIELFVRGKAAWVDHVLRCRVFGPDTLERTAVRRNLVTRTGRAVYAFDLAINEMVGDWAIVVRDVATGLETRHTFKVLNVIPE